MSKRYTVEKGRFGCYFRDNVRGADLDLGEVALYLNNMDGLYGKENKAFREAIRGNLDGEVCNNTLENLLTEQPQLPESDDAS